MTQADSLRYTVGAFILKGKVLHSLRVCLLVSLLVLLLAGCASSGEYSPSVDLWPVFRYDGARDAVSDAPPTRSIEALGPIIKWQSTPALGAFFLRPLFNRREDRESNVVESEWPWPFGFGTRRPDLSRQVIFPLFLRDRDQYSDGSVQNRAILLPIFYYRYGREPHGILIFPLFGHLHNLLGRKETIIVLWPAFIFQRRGEARTWEFLHPVFAFKRWDEGSRGYKFWPLFGIDRRPKTEMLKVFALWPCFQYQRYTRPNGLVRRLAFLPFYGRIDEPGGYARTVIWPLFGHRVDRVVKHNDWWFPWPFFARHLGENKKGFTIWPLFVTRRAPRKHTVQFLWPIGWHSRAKDDWEETRAFRLTPLMFTEREQRIRTGADGVKRTVESGAWQVWPLVKSRREEAGESDVEFPSIFPMRYYAPWERNFAPFFRVFRYHHSEEGERSWRVLSRLVHVKSKPTRRFVEIIGPLFKWEKTAKTPVQESSLRWKVLGRLFFYERGSDGCSWRFLFVSGSRSSGMKKDIETP